MQSYGNYMFKFVINCQAFPECLYHSTPGGSEETGKATVLLGNNFPYVVYKKMGCFHFTANDKKANIYIKYIQLCVA